MLIAANPNYKAVRPYHFLLLQLHHGAKSDVPTESMIRILVSWDVTLSTAVTDPDVSKESAAFIFNGREVTEVF